MGWSEADGGYQQYLKDEEGFLRLRMPYELWFFELEKNELDGSINGKITFKVKTPE